jgi:hypothetical protein
MGPRAQPGLHRGNGLDGLYPHLGMTLGRRELLDMDLCRPHRRGARRGEHQRYRDRQGERQKYRQENEQSPSRQEPLPACARQPGGQGQSRRYRLNGVGGGRCCQVHPGGFRIAGQYEGGAAEVAA